MVRGGEEENPLSVEGMGNFSRTGFYFSGGGRLRRSTFDHWSPFQSKKNIILLILNINQIWSLKSLDLKLKWCSSNDYSYKWSFYCYITWQFLLSGEGTNLWWRKKLFQVLVEWANFWLVARFLSIPHKENSTLLIYIYICNIYIKYIYYIYTYMYIYTYI